MNKNVSLVPVPVNKTFDRALLTANGFILPDRTTKVTLHSDIWM